jgi:hypothetical protein
MATGVKITQLKPIDTVTGYEYIIVDNTQITKRTQILNLGSVFTTVSTFNNYLSDTSTWGNAIALVQSTSADWNNIY